MLVCFVKPYWEFGIMGLSKFCELSIWLFILLRIRTSNILLVPDTREIGRKSFGVAIIFGSFFLGIGTTLAIFKFDGK